MRRWRNVATATLILVAIVYLVAQHQEGLSDDYTFGTPFTESAYNDLGKGIPSNPAASSNSEPIKTPLNTEQQESSPKENLPPPNEELSHLHLSHGPQQPSSSDVQQVPSPEPAQVGFQAEFNFQQDLELDLPVDVLKQFSNNKPHNYDPSGPKTNVYATFMSTKNPSIKDPYYMACHSLIYRLLWSPKSRSEKYAFIVFVSDFVTPEQRQLLAGAGAIVRELAPLEWNPPAEGIQNRWKDLFAKLNMWKETEFSKIYFLDADAFPVANVDSIFDVALQQDCIESKLSPEDHLIDGTSACEPYVFGGVPQDPFNPVAKNVNAGAMVFSPSMRMHQRFLQNYLKFDRYDLKLVEQAFLNWQFDINGAFPAQALERQWGAAFPNEQDEGKVKVIHEKLWTEEHEWMRKEWVDEWVAMTQFYMSDAFANVRAMDGLAQG